jgi:hypothetical protein
MFPSPLLLQRLAEVYIKDALCEVEKARVIREAKRYQRLNEQQAPAERLFRRLLTRLPTRSQGKSQPAHGLTSAQVCCIVIDLRNSGECRTSRYETVTVF